MRPTTFFLTLLALLAIGGSGCAPENTASSHGGSEHWPRQPIQIACFSSAGGGTDTVCRLIASAMEPELGVKINVVNRTGARGGAALNYVWSQQRDGYNWGGFSESIIPAPVMGVHDTTTEDWTYFMVAGAPGLISVSSDSPYRTLSDFLEAAKTRPGELKIAASSTGGIWHTTMLLFQEAAGISLHYIPFQGSHKSQTAVLTGEVDAVLTSVSEQAELLRGQKLRPLAMIQGPAVEIDEVGLIPSATELYPELLDSQITQWLGFALPRDTPPAILEQIGAAFDLAMQKEEVASFARNRLLTLYGYRGEKADRLARSAERRWSWMLHELGITVRHPEEAGIPRP